MDNKNHRSFNLDPCVDDDFIFDPDSIYSVDFTNKKGNTVQKGVMLIPCYTGSEFKNKQMDNLKPHSHFSIPLKDIPDDVLFDFVYNKKMLPMDTIADLFDKLSICNNKIYEFENVKRDAGASDKVIADATRATNVLNSQRNQLKNEINEFFGQGNQKEIKKYGK